MSSDRLTEIRERLEAATPGPWGLVRCDAECGDIDWQAQQEQRPFQVITTILEVLNGRARQDATVIANAPDDIRHLLEAVDRLRDALESIALIGIDMPAAWGDRESFLQRQLWEAVARATRALTPVVEVQAPDTQPEPR